MFINKLRFFNPNITHLLNKPVMSTCSSDFTKKKKNSINQIDMN